MIVNAAILRGFVAIAIALVVTNINSGRKNTCIVIGPMNEGCRSSTALVLVVH